MYIIKDVMLNICIQIDNWRDASRQFDLITDKGRDAVLYSYKDGVFTEIEHITHPKRYAGVMT